MLSPEDIKAARQQYGLGTSQTPGSSFGSSAPVDHSARMARLRGLTSKGTAQPQQEQGSFLGDVSKAFGNVGQGLKESFQMAPGSIDQTQGGWLGNLKQTAEAGLHGVGSLARGINEVAGSAIQRSGIGGALGGLVKHIAGWDSLSPEQQQQIAEGAQHLQSGATEQYNSWKQQHPELARTVEDASQIAQAVPTIEGAGALAKATPELLTETLPQAAKGATETVGKVTKEVLAGGKAKAAEKTLAKIIEDTRPVLSKSEQIAARAAGKETPATMFKPAEIAHEAKDVERAKVLEGIYDPKKDAQANINAIRDARAAEAKQTIADIQKNDSIFNKKQLNAHLDRIEKPVMLTSDATMEKAYDATRNKFMDYVDKNPKKLSGLLKARKQFDSWVDTQFPDLYTNEKMTPLKQAIKDMRSAGNDYIESKLPEGSPFRDQLRKQHLMFEATENLAEQGQKTAGKSTLEQWVKRHPNLWKGAKTGLTLVGGGEVIKHALP